jgi:hypothetical protein
MSITNHRSGETMTGTWQLDPRHSRVEFRVRLLWGLSTVKGHFGDYHGQLDLSANPAIELTIDAGRARDRSGHHRLTPRAGNHVQPSKHGSAPLRGSRQRLPETQRDRGRLTGRLFKPAREKEMRAIYIEDLASHGGPRVMRWRSAREQRSADRGTCGRGDLAAKRN